MFVIYPSVFYYEDGQYSVFFADFEGGTCGSSIEEAYMMAIDWLGINLMDYYLENQPLPKPSDIQKVDIKKCLDFLDTEKEKEEEAKKCFKTLIGFDLVQYIKDTERTVIKNI